MVLTAIANCGFPEANHCATALAICETFARQARFEWAGALALGGGQGIDGVPLAEAGGKTIPIRKSLELTAEAMVQGQAISSNHRRAGENDGNACTDSNEPAAWPIRRGPLPDLRLGLPRRPLG